MEINIKEIEEVVDTICQCTDDVRSYYKVAIWADGHYHELGIADDIKDEIRLLPEFIGVVRPYWFEPDPESTNENALRCLIGDKLFRSEELGGYKALKEAVTQHVLELLISQHVRKMQEVTQDMTDSMKDIQITHEMVCSECGSHEWNISRITGLGHDKEDGFKLSCAGCGENTTYVPELSRIDTLLCGANLLPVKKEV